MRRAGADGGTGSPGWWRRRCRTGFRSKANLAASTRHRHHLATTLHLAHGLLASLQRVLLGIVQASLHLLGLGLQQLLVVLQSLGQILLAAELVGQPGRVNHRLLGLLLGEAGLADHLVQIGLMIKRDIKKRRYFNFHYLEDFVILK